MIIRYVNQISTNTKGIKAAPLWEPQNLLFHAAVFVKRRIAGIEILFIKLILCNAECFAIAAIMKH